MKRDIPKTIFITCFHSLVSRVLESGVLDALLEDGTVRVVLFVPDFKKEYFSGVFGNRDSVIIEDVDRNSMPRRAFLFYKAAFALLDTRTMSLIRRSFRGYARLHERIAAHIAASLIGRWRPLRNVFRLIHYHFSGPPVFSVYFEKYRPALVFSTDIKEVVDVQLIIEAQKRGIATVGMVRSWDYLTAKGMTRVKTDTLIVHNNIIKEEAIRYADMTEERIMVTGIPHYDPYKNTARTERNLFFQKVGISPHKRILLYVPWGEKFADTDWQFISHIDEGIQSGALPSDLHVLVRFPPGDRILLERVRDAKNISVDIPGVPFGSMSRKANEMSLTDLLHLADTLTHSSVVVSSLSTMVIDAAVFNVPAVLMAYDGAEQRGYYEGIRHFYDFSHIQSLLAAEGAAIARNKNELYKHIRNYLNDPNMHADGRKRIVKEQCFIYDGKASKRLCACLRRCIQNTQHDRC